MANAVTSGGPQDALAQFCEAWECQAFDYGDEGETAPATGGAMRRPDCSHRAARTIAVPVPLVSVMALIVLLALVASIGWARAEASSAGAERARADAAYQQGRAEAAIESAHQLELVQAQLRTEIDRHHEFATQVDQREAARIARNERIGRLVEQCIARADIVDAAGVFLYLASEIRAADPHPVMLADEFMRLMEDALAAAEIEAQQQGSEP